MIITSCGNSVNLAKNIAKKLKTKFSKLTISKFPDGDIYLKYNVRVKGKTIVIVNRLERSRSQRDSVELNVAQKQMVLILHTVHQHY